MIEQKRPNDKNIPAQNSPDPGWWMVVGPSFWDYRRLPLSDQAKMLLGALDWLAKEKCYCTPSNDDLAAMTNKRPRAIREILDELVSRGCIARIYTDATEKRRLGIVLRKRLNLSFPAANTEEKLASVVSDLRTGVDPDDGEKMPSDSDAAPTETAKKRRRDGEKMPSPDGKKMPHIKEGKEENNTIGAGDGDSPSALGQSTDLATTLEDVGDEEDYTSLWTPERDKALRSQAERLLGDFVGPVFRMRRDHSPLALMQAVWEVGESLKHPGHGIKSPVGLIRSKAIDINGDNDPLDVPDWFLRGEQAPPLARPASKAGFSGSCAVAPTVLAPDAPLTPEFDNLLDSFSGSLSPLAARR